MTKSPDPNGWFDAFAVSAIRDKPYLVKIRLRGEESAKRFPYQVAFVNLNGAWQKLNSALRIKNVTHYKTIVGPFDEL